MGIVSHGSRIEVAFHSCCPVPRRLTKRLYIRDGEKDTDAPNMVWGHARCDLYHTGCG